MSGSGRFIVLEGIDGSGTTTQAQRLVAALQQQGRQAVFTCEPSSGPIGKQIRQLLGAQGDEASRAWDTLALLFAADRLDHVERELRPALAAGSIVVCDRYDLSSYAYQSATAAPGTDPLPWIRALNQRALRPDLTLVLDVDPAVAEQRRIARGLPAELFERRGLQRRLAQLYARAEQLVPGDRVVHIAADEPLPEVAERVWQAVAGSLAADKLQPANVSE
ncbi:MAG TPA: dTMP kinase [Polyangiaceae bacterium]|nr:dTMP kinase [Polyangiaceae bacterium]